MQSVWYVLQDGRTVDPNECAPDDAGELFHSSGVAVDMRAPGVPRSRGVDVELERAKAAAADAGKPGGKDMKSPADREMRGKRGKASDYETR